jgi:multidrug efflux pump subunit AcrA (membrane-fusion protein)
VTKYTPARPATPKAAETTKKQSEGGQGKGGGGGGGRGGGGGGGGGRGGGGGGGGRKGFGNPEDEKPGSTRIVWILPDGSRVKGGDVVAGLDSSSYVEEERSQNIRYLQAKSYVDQAESMLEVAQITLREYRDGIYPQDLQLIRQYIESCQIEQRRSASNLKWSREMLAMSFRTPFQVRGDELALQNAEIALKEAEGMLERLAKWTGPKIIKSLEANVAAIQADLLNQKASFSLETQRLERLRRNIASCEVKAPGDGIVVYANQANGWGMVTDVIDEGVTLREKQPIFNLPDPLHMRVRAKINESKVALIQTNQPVIIRIDAFPDRPLRGVVAEVTPISIPLRGSDVRIYYANVDIIEGFDKLRPGLSAEILIAIEQRQDVTRVPVESIRWFDSKPHVALYDKAQAEAGREPWRWRQIEIGLTDPTFAEVIKGLNPGDRVVARPATLPPPEPVPVARSSARVAALTPR